MCVLLCKKLLHSFLEFSLKYSSLWLCFLVAPHPFQYLNDLFFFRFIFVHAGSSLMREDFSPIAASGEYCPVAMRRLFIAAASLAVKQGLLHTGFSSGGAWLSCSSACGIFLDQGSNFCLLHWQAHSLSLSTREAHGHSFKFWLFSGCEMVFCGFILDFLAS